MNDTRGRDGRRQPSAAAKHPATSAGRRPSPEVIVIVVAIILPCAVFCWRMVRPGAGHPTEAATDGSPAPAVTTLQRPASVPRHEESPRAVQPRPPEGPPATGQRAPVGLSNEPLPARRVLPPPTASRPAAAPVTQTASGAKTTRDDGSARKTIAPRPKPTPNAASAPRPTVIVGAGHGLPAVPRVAAPGGAGRGTDGLKADHQPPGSVPTTDGDADRLSGDSEDSSPPPGSATGDDSLGGLGAAAAAGEQVEKLLADAWGLIERGDHQVGRRVLLEARRAGRNDLRSDFSLGLLDALVVHDWPSAEKHFVQCARREPGHIASLNNLALVRLRTAWGKTALRTWEEVLDQGVPPSEVVQNLGRLRHLVQAGKVPKRTKDAKLAEAVEQLYIRAATAANQSAQPHMGFLFMGMKRADNRTIGWSDAKKYEDAWCLVCLGKGQVKCPNANCLRGTVKAPAFQGGGRVTCDSCGGYAAMACKACINGKDRDVRWTPTAPMYRTIGAGVTVPVPQPGINVGPLGPVMSPFAPRK